MTELNEQLLFDFMGDFELVDKPNKERKEYEVSFDDEPHAPCVGVKLTYGYKVVLLRRKNLNGSSFSLKNSMSTGKRTMDDGKPLAQGATNIFAMNFIDPSSKEYEQIYPANMSDIKYTDVNEVDIDSTENMLLGMDYQQRPKPNFGGLTQEQQAAGMVEF